MGFPRANHCLLLQLGMPESVLPAVPSMWRNKLWGSPGQNSICSHNWACRSPYFLLYHLFGGINCGVPQGKTLFADNSVVSHCHHPHAGVDDLGHGEVDNSLTTGYPGPYILAVPYFGEQ